MVRHDQIDRHGRPHAKLQTGLLWLPQKQWKRNLMCAARGELSGERKFGRGPPQYCEQSAPEMIEEKHDRSKLPMLMRTPWKNCIHNTFASALVAFAKFLSA